ncbi:hypothetical protein YW5DRAFT_03033 [Streptomyces sp. Ncost-T6T-1]|uniref:hypothetical protein n=1 Tax=Streptomyces sp. Ncost-T6T-1 TaxID=1100828 RepID=UPI000804F25E|nr:hypothetical protein [Streptomyces sp. Ncost-T6T-1]SBV05634.1 hypothetical protein YW5DRAFT_03033 [Streptomyces sp. Ncost-T6T-1]
MADIDYHLRRQVSQLTSLVNQLDQGLVAVSGQVAGVEATQRDTRDSLQKLRDDFQEFVRSSQLADAIQRAETRIGVIQDRIEHDFGHHKVVRRTTVGLLQAFDTGLVSEESVRAVSDELMIQTPRYWLAPALVALAAWSSDDRALCERAVTEAFRRSPRRTSLLFALILRRQNRQAAAVRWLLHYLRAQDPTALGREFAVILESVAQGAFGPAGRELLRSVLDEWLEMLLEGEQAVTAQVRRWRAEVEAHRAPSAKADFPKLAAMSPQWPTLESVLGAAEAHRALLEKYTRLMSQEIRTSHRVEDLVDDILDRLVSEYDDEELPLRRDLAYNEAVLAHDGDAKAARQAADADATSLEEKLDYLTVQSASALNPAAIGVSAATQRLAVGACHDWFRQAHAEFSRDYRLTIPTTVEAAFETSHNLGAQTFGLPRWTGAFTTPMEQLERSLSEHWDTHVRPFVAGLVPAWRTEVVPPAVVLVFLLIVSMAVHPGAGLIITLVAGGIWALVIARGRRGALERQRYAQSVLDRSKADSLLQLRAAGAELVDYESRFRNADAQEPAVREMIDGLAGAGAGNSPFEARVVRPAGSPTGETS